MNQKHERPQLIIEWDKDWTRVIFTESGQTRESSSLSNIEGVQGKSAIVLVSRRNILFRVLSLPDATRSDVLIALKMKLGDVFPIPVNELAFDYIPTADKDENGRLCHVFAVKTEDIHEVIKLTESLDITVHSIAPAQSGLIRLSQKDGVSSGVYVERFGDFVNLDIIKEGKLTYSRATSLEALDVEVERAKSQVPDAKIFSYNVGLDGTEQKLPSNLASRFLESDSLIDLEPESYRLKKEDKARSKRHRQSYLIFAAGAVIGMVVYMDFSDKNDKFAKEAKRLKSKLSIAKLATERPESTLTKLQPQAAQLKLAFEPAQKMSDVMKLSSILLPKDAWLTSLSLERGKPLQIRGTAKNSEAVSAYLKELTKQKRLRDVRLLFANSGDIDGSPVVQFSVSAFPVGNLPIVETGKQKKK